jgi:glutamate dehydrogenase/leucine dehydrogenase
MIEKLQVMNRHRQGNGMTAPLGDALLRSLAWEHERVELVHDHASRLSAVIAIHSTVLGPALGGLRMRHYEHGFAEALDDALRLSRAMTLKAAAAGLDLGGGKAVVLDDGLAALRPARLVALAREIERLGGAYITAEDIGTTTADMDLIGEHTTHVVGRGERHGLGGDPSPDTARTVLGAMRAALSVIDGDQHLSGRTVGVVGLGKVGGQLASWLVEAGAHVVGFDAMSGAAQAVRSHGVELVDSVDEILARKLDVFAPCATGGMIDERMARALRCRVVCGAANNPLTGEAAATVLARRGILYVPDFLANCGGLLHVDSERRGIADKTYQERALTQAYDRTRDVLLEARADGRLPSAVAEEHAWARIDQARMKAVGGKVG